MVEPHVHAVGQLFPPHGLGGRTHALHVGRFARGVAGQDAAAFHHHAQAAKAEHLDFHVGVFNDVLDLAEGEHAGQHGATDAEQLLHEVDGLVIGGRPLHRHVQPQVGVAIAGIGHDGRIRHDDGVGAQQHGGIDGSMPALHFTRLRKGVDGHEHLTPTRMGIGHAFLGGFHVEIEPREIARVGGVLQPHVDRVCAIVHRRLQGRQVTRRAYQFRNPSHYLSL